MSLGDLQQEHPAEFAVLDQQQSRPARISASRSTESIPNVFGLQGSPLAESPLYPGQRAGALRVPAGRVQGIHAGGRAIQRQLPGRTSAPWTTTTNRRFATFDASVGVAKDAWNVSVLRAESRQQECQHLHQLGAVRPDADGAASANRGRACSATSSKSRRSGAAARPRLRCRI